MLEAEQTSILRAVEVADPGRCLVADARCLSAVGQVKEDASLGANGRRSSTVDIYSGAAELNRASRAAIANCENSFVVSTSGGCCRNAEPLTPPRHYSPPVALLSPPPAVRRSDARCFFRRGRIQSGQCRQRSATIGCFQTATTYCDVRGRSLRRCYSVATQ